MFVIITTFLCRHSAKTANTTESTHPMVRRHLLVAAVLSILFGLGWAFGMIGTSSLPKEVYIPAQYIFSILMGLQGVLIIILHGICSPDVHEEWKQLWNIAVNKSRNYLFLKSGSATKTVNKESTNQTKQLNPTSQCDSLQLGSITLSDKLSLISNSEKQPNEEEIMKLTSPDREGVDEMPGLASC